MNEIARIPKICSICVLPTDFPGVQIGENGVCNFCREFPPEEIRIQQMNRYQHRCDELFNRERGRHRYDAVMCFSGGKDSSYTLGILKERYSLKILALTLDNGFISEQAKENIRSVVETLGVDHLYFKPRFDLLTRIFKHCAYHDIFPVKTLERASTICTACMTFTKFTALRLAIEEDIPFIAFGWSPGQAPITSSIMKNNPLMVRAMQEAILKPMRVEFGDELNSYFLDEDHFTQKSESFPYNIHPMAFLPYDENRIYSDIARFGWKAPQDVDPNSTNCQLNTLANAVHKERFAINPYTFELAGLVRSGCMERETAISRLQQPEDPQIVSSIAAKLGLSQSNRV